VKTTPNHPDYAMHLLVAGVKNMSNS